MCLYDQRPHNSACERERTGDGTNQSCFGWKRGWLRQDLDIWVAHSPHPSSLGLLQPTKNMTLEGNRDFLDNSVDHWVQEATFWQHITKRNTLINNNQILTNTFLSCRVTFKGMSGFLWFPSYHALKCGHHMLLAQGFGQLFSICTSLWSKLR